MAAGPIALASDDYEPPAWIPKVRKYVPVQATRVATILVADTAFILFIVEDTIQHRYSGLLWALLPVQSSSSPTFASTDTS